MKKQMKKPLNEEFKRMQKLAGLNEKTAKENWSYLENQDFDIDDAFNSSPNKQSYEDILDVVKEYEDEEYLKSFISTFPKGEDINKEDWIEWSLSISDYDPEGYTYLNWISLSDPDVYKKAGIL